jgi:hypothetical protein
MSNDDALRYPVGKFSMQPEYSFEEVQKNIQLIRELPGLLEAALKNCTHEQLDTPYRDGGWTIRQVIHHLADSHLNAFIRIKWALTESNPVIKAYDEKLWAETPETKADPSLSINLLNALHAKWVALLNGFAPEDFKKTFIHPASGKEVPMDRQIALYAWHGLHHLGHIKLVVK